MRLQVFALAILAMTTLGICAGCNKAERGTNDKEVEAQLNNRMDYFIRLYGSKDKLEKATGKTLAEIKTEYRPVIAAQVAAEQAKNQAN